MDSTIFNQEKSHLSDTLSRIKNAKKVLEQTLNSLGSANLERLQELRENPEKGMDFAYFMEQLQEKNESMNIADKFARLEEFKNIL